MRRAWFLPFLIVLLITVPNDYSRAEDCPDCFRLVKVDVELKSGRVATGYFEHYPAFQPVVSGNDAVSVIDIGLADRTGKPPTAVRLLDSLFRIDNITVATSIPFIDSMKTAYIEQVRLLEEVGFAAAGGINIYDKTKLDQLRQPPRSIYRDTVGNVETILLGYHDELSQERLDAFGDYYIKIGADPDARYNQFLERMIKRRRLYGDSWTETFTDYAASEVLRLKNELRRVKELAADDAIGRYFRRTDELIRLRIYFIDILSRYSQGGDLDEMLDSCRALLAVDADSSVVSALYFEKYIEDNFVHIIDLMRIYYDAYSVNRRLGEEYLGRSGLLMVTNRYR